MYDDFVPKQKSFVAALAFKAGVDPAQKSQVELHTSFSPKYSRVLV